MNAQWKDATSYSRDDTEREKTAWSLDVGHDVRIVITSNHLYHPGEWVMHCRPWFDTYLMKIPTGAPAEVAQKAALALIRGKIDALHAALHSIG